MSTMVTGEEEGNGDGGKSDGDGDEGGGQATARRAKATSMRAMATVTGVVCDKEEAMARVMPNAMRDGGRRRGRGQQGNGDSDKGGG